ncbi:MAG: 16S rRNA (guanine(966)-N(2))-methyltransferase RsmD [Lachnospiraceae bacterium]|nr:16S rRNA (guanine(966)-N(2))-methyltransferase RsmD [Lachnospiraceae bacterium]
MRIIAGTARSLPLKTISGIDTRPTTDRIKETLFNMLNPFLLDSCFLDLYAGSGQIGLEAVSRGARSAVFVENSKKAAACIGENIRFTKFTENCTLLVKDAVTAIRQMKGAEPFDVVFMDPPYGKGLEEEALSALADSGLLHEDSVIVVETARGMDLSYACAWGYEITKEKTYKNNQHIFMKFARETV